MTELLAPAGNMEALQAAINAGADAIYVGGSRFNARAYATNFDIEELRTAVKLCHLHGVRLFVTINTIYKEEEIEDLYSYLNELYEMQVDALIIQDEGLMHLVQEHFVDFEIHASTQCSVHHREGVLHYQSLGVKRVVVARENSLEEIQDMVQNTNTEIEVFVHGALCVSYSGQCYMSQMIGKRSANRGQCAQPCRLTYQLLLNDKPISQVENLLSCKDLCTLENIDQLLQAGIASFKIEGRMKRPAYVYAVTKAYRDAMDGYQNSKDKDKLRQIFNRDFTNGYLFSENQIVSSEYAGNRGILLGEVIGYKKTSKRLVIKNYIAISQGDGIRIGYTEEGKILNKIYLDGKLVNHIPAGKIFETDFSSFVQKNTKIYRTTSILLEKDINLSLHQLTRRVPIEMTLSGNVGASLFLTISDQQNVITVSTQAPIEKARQKADLIRIQEQLEKLGNTIYTVKTCALNISDDCFIPVKQINELRRLACEKLDQCRENRRVREIQRVQPLTKAVPLLKELKKTYYHFHSIGQLKAALPKQNGEIFFFDLTSEFEQAKQLDKELGLVVPTIINDDLLKKIDQLIIKYPDLKIACNNVASYHRYQKNAFMLLPGMNLSHVASLNCYPIPAVISNELEDKELKYLESLGASFIVQTYGHIDNMLTKFCPVSYLAHGKKIEGCNACKKGKYDLLDRANAKFDLMFDEHCIIHVLSEKPIKRKWPGACYLRFTFEDHLTVKKILESQRK